MKYRLNIKLIIPIIISLFAINYFLFFLLPHTILNHKISIGQINNSYSSNTKLNANIINKSTLQTLTDTSQLKEYNGEINCLTFKCLLAYPEYALDINNKFYLEYDSNHITPYEFTNILQSLYNKNYILIKTTDIYNINNNGELILKTIFLPENKKPLLLNFEDISYSQESHHTGLIDKIVLDTNNLLANYTTRKSIKDRIDYSNDFIVLLESFIKKYPTFSLNNAKGIIGFTGENGILGYNVQRTNAVYKTEIKKVLKIINKLKNNGWEFASNGYYQKLHQNITDQEWNINLEKWKNEIYEISNYTNIFSYLSNEIITLIDTYKFKILQNNFTIIITSNASSEQPTIIKNSLVIDSYFISGNTLRNNNEYYRKFFTPNEVYDHLNRPTPFNPE